MLDLNNTLTLSVFRGINTIGAASEHGIVCKVKNLFLHIVGAV